MLSILILSASHFLRARLPLPDARLGVFAQTTAAIQGVVAILALTSYHVQIINRLASGYFVWYWWIAGSLVESGNGEKSGLKKGTGRGLVTFMVMYGAIQGALYASFLPPA
jgi:GPI mannosyltransferase 2